MKRNPRVFFSFRSPFSWMAVERLRRAIPNVHELLEFIPYWEPDQRTRQVLQQRGVDIHYAPMSKAKHLYILQDTKRLADELGLRIAWPVDRTPWWEITHLGWLKARHMGRAAEFYNAVVEARWLRGQDISSTEVVRKISDSAGLDAEAILASLHTEQILDEGVGCLTEAYEDDIFGVPYFRIGPHRFWGVDRVDRFIALLKESLNQDQDAATAGLTSRRKIGAAFDNHAHSALSPAMESSSPMRHSPSEAYDNDTAGGCG